jgi:RND family efflux transporter MFP subunit
VPVYSSFVGTTSSIRKVDIRARVKGFLTEQNFKEGDFVKGGELMYVIDESPFKASLDEITAQLEKDKAQLEFANKQVERYKGLVDKEYVSREAYDKYVTDAKSSQAVVDADLANLEKAKLDLGYMRMSIRR